MPLASTSYAADLAVEEIVVYGNPEEIVLDKNAWRIDGKQHADIVARSVQDALSATAPRVASALERDRG